ncbi:hypothetical protein [Flavihumibacter fluvii]|uniref:hypothetical protein n=1 Tax=Flavihumibacter fluvii TaxID=2838157 RepID=UPI001BDE85D6|nr:hypothetical protein [Flavihumibacter fluvii]ULQ51578.1 hypothetical protein KJS93_15925 [Flavihumibacter fluvii]
MTMLPSSPFRELQIIYRVLLYSQIGFWIIALLLIQFNIFQPFAAESLDRLLQVIAVFYSFIAVIVGLQLFRRRLESIKLLDIPARDKLIQYKSASIVQWALLEGAGIFCIICYIITGNWSFLGLAIMLLAVFGGLNPFKQKVMLQLRLSDTDVTGM